MATWFDGVKDAEAFNQKRGTVSCIPDYERDDYGHEYTDGWNDYVRNNARSQELARIEAEYCHTVVNISYALHTELEVLCILQQLQDKRRQKLQDLQQKFAE